MASLNHNDFTELTNDILEVANPSEPEDLQEDIRLLYQFINQLPALHRALMIIYLDQKTYQEIAEILAIVVALDGFVVNHFLFSAPTVSTAILAARC